MENFFYNDTFYPSMEDLLFDLEFDTSDGVNAFFEVGGEFIEVKRSNHEPVVQFSLDWIMDRINEDRFSEDDSDNSDYAKTKKAILECVDFEKLNAMIPKLYYESNCKTKISKQEIIDCL